MEKRYGTHWSEKKTFHLQVGKGEYEHHFGGVSYKLPKCTICNNQMQQIITLDLKDPKLNELETNLSSLPLVGCLNCSLNWEEQCYEILPKENKIIYKEIKNSFNFIQENEDKIPSPLPIFNCSLSMLPDEDLPTNEENYWNTFDNAGNQYFCRILGSPLFTQEYTEKRCPCCDKKMKYVATIVGGDYGNTTLLPNFEFYFGDFYIYYYICNGCLIVISDSQEL